VERIMLEELMSTSSEAGKGRAIPVLLRLEPGRAHFGDSREGIAMLERTIEAGIPNGLRATLATGSFLTGSLYVSLDVHPEAEAAEQGTFAGRPTIPTIATGLDVIEQKVSQLLDKLNGLHLEEVTDSVDATLREVKVTIAELRALIASQGIQSLPHSIESSLDELERTLKSIRALADSLESQPSALIFPSDPIPDPEPRASTP
jgi:paraquat-inducible protein B